MIPFLIVLCAALFGFTFTFQALNGPEAAITDAFTINFRLMFGDFDTGGYTFAGWFLFIVSTCLLPLIMLNLLIAIMSDSYARVMSNIIPSDYYELNSMILE